MIEAQLIKGDPPPPVRTQGGYRNELIAKLRADPNEWYEATRAGNWGSNSKSDFIKTYPNIEAQMRRAGDETDTVDRPRYRMWLRWVESGES